MVEVWHLYPKAASDNISEAMFFGLTPEQAAAVVKGLHNKFKYVRVASIATDDLDDAYRLSNSIHCYWGENPEVRLEVEPLLQNHALGYRSTSIGDLLKVNGSKAHVVATFGFAEVNIA